MASWRGFVGVACVAGGLLALWPQDAVAQRVVRVESQDRQYSEYRTSTRGGVHLLRQLSRDPCIEGRTWGFDRRGIWVDQGCRGEFEIGGASPAAGAVGQIVRVESRNGTRSDRRIATRGGVRLYRQLSRDPCIEGQTWGFDRDAIWVDKGCRAEFELMAGRPAVPASAGRTVRVESRDGQYAYRKTSTRGGVRLRRQLSRDPCIEGQTWGFDRDGIWVNQGCRAEFQVGS